MSRMSKVSMVNGELFMIQIPPEELHKILSNSNKESGNLFHEFELKSGEIIYLQSLHVVSIEGTGETTSLTDSLDKTSIEQTDENNKSNNEKNRAASNLEAAKEFKKDLDGNME
ncbi:hypothetical protein BKP56_10030 [Marinilactibacillus sp. 15R]|uniref:Uncharacterized protein n=1 Tax=Marinilactibacillus piezotolerans TaxID=258723 RepID=A0A1I3V6P0_9LACT|nr:MULTISPECIES: hypothetical protein [Marinilactibacillus]API89573.1 hypothetical protein BKP56_10030 [Marinilactibacillus sp. 15R]SFJ89857.1 hypothetical protein SAMN04488569_100223 [Marinilactibacillus piezotolerans]